MTKITINPTWNNQLHTDGYAVFVPQDEKEISKSLSFLHKDELATLVSEIKHEKFQGKLGELFSFPLWMSKPGRRIILVGIGPQKDITDETLRKAAGLATRAASKAGVGTLAFRVRRIFQTMKQQKMSCLILLKEYCFLSIHLKNINQKTRITSSLYSALCYVTKTSVRS